MRYLIVTITIFGIITATSLRDIYDTQWALIIGIDKYHNEKNLEYAVKDAEAVRDLLISHFGYSKNNITLLRNDEATLQNIKTHLGKIASQTKQNDAFLIFFAGHGITQPTQEGGEMGYLLPVDGDKGNVYATCLPMTELKTIGSISRAKHVLFLMDACYGGLMALEYRSLGKETPGYLAKLAREKSRQIITAGGIKQPHQDYQATYGGKTYDKEITPDMLQGLRNQRLTDVMTKYGDIKGGMQLQLDRENLEAKQQSNKLSQEVHDFNVQSAANQVKQQEQEYYNVYLPGFVNNPHAYFRQIRRFLH